MFKTEMSKEIKKKRLEGVDVLHNAELNILILLLYKITQINNRYN